MGDCWERQTPRRDTPLPHHHPAQTKWGIQTTDWTGRLKSWRSEWTSQRSKTTFENTLDGLIICKDFWGRIALSRSLILLRTEFFSVLWYKSNKILHFLCAGLQLKRITRIRYLNSRSREQPLYKKLGPTKFAHSSEKFEVNCGLSLSWESPWPSLAAL